MESDVSLPCLNEQVTYLYFELAETNLRPTTMLI